MPPPAHDHDEEVVLVTGAAGRIGTYLRHRLAKQGRSLRLLDLSAPVDPGPGEKVYVGSIRDRSLVREAAEGAHAVVHLGGIPTESSWEDILAVNVDGTQSVFEAAAASPTTTRVILASSNHALGFWERPKPGADVAPLPDTAEHRPDTYYGWSKAAGEVLGRLYHERYGLTVVNVRIGFCGDHPRSEFGLGIWLSPDDAGRLVEAALAPAVTGFHTVWGVSANTRRWWSTEGGAAIGFEPKDDSEQFADEVEPDSPPPDRLGSGFTTAPLGRPI